jgi:DNA-binding MurR/RpiR family transcriptional regulator
LTPSQRRIARDVFHHVNDVLMATQAQLAAQVGTSEATVSRFIPTLWFTKFHRTWFIFPCSPGHN